MKNISFKKTIVAVAVTAALAACGGGSGSSSSGGGSVSTGVVTATSPTGVTVNGVAFNQTNARVSVNDSAGSGLNRGIKLGMTIKIRGSTDSTTDTGVASAIEISHEVEGVIAGLSGDTFTVHGQLVRFDTQTVYDGFLTNNSSALANGLQVEVYGLYEANGDIRATLIELEDVDFEDEVRGVVSNLNTIAGTFNIGDLLVHYDTTMTAVEDGTLAMDLINGAVVEVHLDTSFTPNHAIKIEFEDNEDDEFEAHDGDDVEIEGYVSSYDSVAGTFMIGDVSVRVNGSTVYEGPGALGNDVLVEVEGTMVDGVLVASEVEFED